MKNALITLLRNKDTKTDQFRDTANKLSEILAVQSTEHLKEKEISVQTVFKKTTGHKLQQDIILIPILRAGLAFLPTFLKYYQNAKVGFLGLKRDEKTAVAQSYYTNLPKIKKNDFVIMLDPMIATGGGAISALKTIKEQSINEKNILFVSIITSTEGVANIKKSFPDIKIIYMVQDKKLNKNKFIVPGIGDFGDRYFNNLPTF